MQDQEHIQACKEGRLEDFEYLYSTYVEQVYRFVYYRVKDKETAEDIVSDTFLKALKAIDRFKSGGSFKAWIFTIARNTLIDYYRSKKDTLSLDLEDTPVVADSQDVEREVGAQIELEEVKKAIETLPEDQRDIVIMRVWDGLSYKEIAEIVGKKEGNCKVIYSRAIVQIRELVPLSAFVLLFINHFEI